MEGILYSAVACGPVLLTSYSRVNSDFESTAKDLVAKIPSYTNTKTCFNDKENVFHVMVESGITYLCTTNINLGKRVPYAFLSEVQRRFQLGTLNIRAEFAKEQEFNREFGYILEDLTEQFSRPDAVKDQVGQLQNQVNDVIGIMSQNIEKVLERGEKIDHLLDKTEDLEQGSSQFTVSSRKLRRKMWWQNVKMWVIIVLIAAVVLTIIILMATKVIPV